MIHRFFPSLLLLILATAGIARLPVHREPGPGRSAGPLPCPNQRNRSFPPPGWLVLRLYPHDRDGRACAVSHAIRIRWTGATDPLEVERQIPFDPLPLLRGSDPAAWQRAVPSFATVLYRDVRPEVDIRVTLEGDGSSPLSSRSRERPAEIAFAYDGADRISRDPDGVVRIETRAGTWIHDTRSGRIARVDSTEHMTGRRWLPIDCSRPRMPPMTCPGRRRLPIDRPRMHAHSINPPRATTLPHFNGAASSEARSRSMATRSPRGPPERSSSRGPSSPPTSRHDRSRLRFARRFLGRVRGGGRRFRKHPDLGHVFSAAPVLTSPKRSTSLPLAISS